MAAAQALWLKSCQSATRAHAQRVRAFPMEEQVGRLCFCRVRSDNGLRDVPGLLLEAAEESIVVGGRSVTGVANTQLLTCPGGQTVMIFRMPRDNVHLEQPADWSAPAWEAPQGLMRAYWQQVSSDDNVQELRQVKGRLDRLEALLERAAPALEALVQMGPARAERALAPGAAAGSGASPASAPAAPSPSAATPAAVPADRAQARAASPQMQALMAAFLGVEAPVPAPPRVAGPATGAAGETQVFEMSPPRPHRRGRARRGGGTGAGAEGPGLAAALGDPRLAGLAPFLESEALGEESPDGDDEDELGLSTESEAYQAPGGGVKASRFREMWRPESRKTKGKAKIMNQLIMQGLSSGDLSTKDVMQMMVWQQAMGRKQKGAASGMVAFSTGEDESDVDADDFFGMKGKIPKDCMRHMMNPEILAKRILHKPDVICKTFEKQAREELGVAPGQAWTLKDWLKSKHFGRFKATERMIHCDVRAYELLRSGQTGPAAAQLAQNIKAKYQSVLSDGDYSIAMLMAGVKDPCAKDLCAGTAAEMTMAAGFLNAKETLRKALNQVQPQAFHDASGASSSGLHPVAEVEGNPTRPTRGDRRAEAKRRAQAVSAAGAREEK